MGFRLSRWDEKLIHFAKLFEKELMDLNVNCSLEQALDIGWKILGVCFTKEEVGIKQAILDKFWDKPATRSL
jgi:V/A-type H+-transporting ATPase subunit B